MANSDPVLLAIDGSIATLTLNRPDAFNSIGLVTARLLEQYASEIEGNPLVRVVVLQSEGRAFSAGGDLRTLGHAVETNAVESTVGELLKHYHAFIEALRRMPKIVISSVHGSAAGAGMALAFVTDLCIASDDAKFTPGYAAINVTPDGGSTVGMVGTVGVRRALQIFLLEDDFTARQALEWGLVARVVPADELKKQTKQLAEQLAHHQAKVIAGTKRLIYQASNTPIKDQLDAEGEQIIDCMLREEFRTAVRKFVSKTRRAELRS